MDETNINLKITQAAIPQNGTPLDSSPPQEPFVDGMTLGSGINAMTGELLGFPLHPELGQRVGSRVKELERVARS